jgi:hypothetical protein
VERENRLLKISFDIPARYKVTNLYIILNLFLRVGIVAGHAVFFHL